jgi:hypothetical protein
MLSSDFNPLGAIGLPGNNLAQSLVNLRGFLGLALTGL